MKFDIARKILIEEVKSNKKTLVGMIEEGSRDFEVQEMLFKKYVNCQAAADALLELEVKE